MSINTDNGDQVLTFDYNVRANASLFNKLIYKILPVGLYGDMPTLEIVSNSEVAVGKFNAVIEDTINELAIKVSTTSTASAVVSSSAPYIVARYTWSETDENYVEILGVSESNLSDQYAIIGLCVYDGSTLESFDTSVQDDKTRALQTVMDVVEAEIDDLQSLVGQSLNTDDSPTFEDISITGMTGTVESRIETNSTNISSNDSDISTLISRVDSNDTDITTLQGRATTLEGKVGQSLNTSNSPTFADVNITGLTGTVEGRIETNSADIDTLKGKVGQSLNTSNSPTFADVNITGLSGTVESRIETNTTDIATKVTDGSSADLTTLTVSGDTTVEDLTVNGNILTTTTPTEGATSTLSVTNGSVSELLPRGVYHAFYCSVTMTTEGAGGISVQQYFNGEWKSTGVGESIGSSGTESSSEIKTLISSGSNLRVYLSFTSDSGSGYVKYSKT